MKPYSKLSDTALINQMKSDDHAAFTEIYHRYKLLLYRNAYQRLRNEDEVDDIIHELFTAIWVKRHTLLFKDNLAGYLYTALRNRIIDHISHKKIESTYIASFQHFIDREENYADFLLREKQLNILIDKEISLLPDKMREVFEMSRKVGYSHKEISEKLGISEKTVKNQVNNALKILRVKLGLLFIFTFF